MNIVHNHNILPYGVYETRRMCINIEHFMVVGCTRNEINAADIGPVKMSYLDQWSNIRLAWSTVRIVLTCNILKHVIFCFMFPRLRIITDLLNAS